MSNDIISYYYVRDTGLSSFCGIPDLIFTVTHMIATHALPVVEMRKQVLRLLLLQGHFYHQKMDLKQEFTEYLLYTQQLSFLYTVHFKRLQIVSLVTFLNKPSSVTTLSLNQFTLKVVHAHCLKKNE